ncbi:MAG: FixH family protein [Gammaproteobacteria bacterium]|nr:FixH family protein [Gammaproteobacteria bacterium]MDH5728090.1 FixH family protein [Gammaproteobacteria bacterium]
MNHQHDMHGLSSVPNIPTPIYSEKKLFKLTLTSKINPPPLSKIHQWVLHLETAEGKPIEQAHVQVYGGMPMHKHGFPTHPQVTQSLGKGNYLIDGIKFSMPGHWEIWLNVQVGKQRDKAIVKLNIS